jgi:hypothetical protein
MKAAPGRIRIIGGHLRNSRLNVPDLPGLRPTAERVRETLFNWLAPTIAGVRALDLCAGTGALGIEALSRGAQSVQFVEPHAASADALRGNLARLKALGGEVACMDAAHFLERAATPGWSFSIRHLPCSCGRRWRSGWSRAAGWRHRRRSTSNARVRRRRSCPPTGCCIAKGRPARCVMRSIAVTRAFD